MVGKCIMLLSRVVRKILTTLKLIIYWVFLSTKLKTILHSENA